MTLRKFHRVALVIFLLSIPASYFAALYLSPWLFIYFVWAMIVGPMCIAAYLGGNPYSPDSWQKQCSKHQYTHYTNDGCMYCVSESFDK